MYKKKTDGTDKRIRNKIKKSLKLAHNYVREFLNQKLKKKAKGEKDTERVISDEPRMKKSFDTPYDTQPYMAPPKSKTIIRRFS